MYMYGWMKYLKNEKKCRLIQCFPSKMMGEVVGWAEQAPNA